MYSAATADALWFIQIRRECCSYPDCGQTEYPKISPAVIIGVIHNDKLLMSKYAGRGDVPYYALIAGFTEIGETVEETVKREVYGGSWAACEEPAVL